MAAPPSLHDSPAQVEQLAYVPIWVPCCEEAAASGKSCGVLFGSYVRLGRIDGLDCDQPLRLVYSCGASRVKRCDRRRQDKCLPCSQMHKRYLIRRAEHGCEQPGFIYLATFTAPGSEEHQRLDAKLDGKWANSGHPSAKPGWRRRNQPRPDCSCCLPAAGLEAWNPTAGACWNRLRLGLSRLAGTVGGLEYLRVVEVQDRGALHHHVLIRTPVELDPNEVQVLAVAAGYGCSVDLSPMPPARAARYVAKYAAKGYTDRGDVPWRDEVLDKETGELVPRQTAAYRTVSQSSRWGMTLRQIRDEIRAARERSRAVVEDQVLVVDSVPVPVAAGPDPPT